jgi:hypothetical protein
MAFACVDHAVSRQTFVHLETKRSYVPVHLSVAEALAGHSGCATSQRGRPGQDVASCHEFQAGNVKPVPKPRDGLSLPEQRIWGAGQSDRWIDAGLPR